MTKTCGLDGIRIGVVERERTRLATSNFSLVQRSSKNRLTTALFIFLLQYWALLREFPAQSFAVRPARTGECSVRPEQKGLFGF